MIIYGSPKSRTLRCLWLLEQLGVEYKHENVVPGEETSKQWFRDLNPNGKIPAFKDGDVVIFESAAICCYLARKFSEKGLIPQSITELALFDQWMFFVMSELEQPLWTIGKHKFALPKEHRVEGIKKTALYEWAKAVSVLEVGLENKNKYILGDRLSVCDIMIVQTLQWARNFKVDIDSERVNSYRKRVTALDSFQRTVKKYLS